MQLLMFTIVAIPIMVGARTVLDAARKFWHIEKVLKQEQIIYLLNQKAKK